MDAIAAAEDAQRAAGPAAPSLEPIGAAVSPPGGASANADDFLGAMFDTAEDDELEAALMLPDPHTAAKRAAREAAGEGQGPSKRRHTEKAGGPSAADVAHEPTQLASKGVDAPPGAKAAVSLEPPSERLVPRAASAQAAPRSSPAAPDVPARTGASKRRAASSPAAGAPQSETKRPRRQPQAQEQPQATDGETIEAFAAGAGRTFVDGGVPGGERTSPAGDDATGDELRREAERRAARDRVSASPDTPPDRRRRPLEQTGAVPAILATSAVQSIDAAVQRTAPEPSGLPSTGTAPAAVPCCNDACSYDPV